MNRATIVYDLRFLWYMGQITLPFLHLAVVGARDRIVRPIGAAHSVDIAKREPERDLGALGCDGGGVSAPSQR